jgi:hypothetical protein
LPVEAQQTIDEARPDLLPEGVSKEDQLSTVTGVQPAEPAFRLAENTTLMPDGSRGAASCQHGAGHRVCTCRGPTDIDGDVLVGSGLAVVESVDAMVVQEIVELAPIEMSSEGTVSPDLPEPWIEPIAAEVEETVVQPQASAEPVRPPVSESEFAPVLAQESMPLSEADSPLQAPTGEPLAERIECVPVPMDSIQQPSAVAEIQTAPMAPVEESVPALMPVESVDGPEPVGSAGVTEVTKVELPADSAAFPVPEESTPATRTPSEPEGR